MPGELAQKQQATKSYLVFSDFETMDTQQARIGLPPNKLAWCENLQIIGANDLQTVAAPDTSAFITLSSTEIITFVFYANYNNSDFFIVFCQSGSAYQVNISTGVSTMFAPSGTFSTTPDCTIWASQRILIADSTAGYCTYDGTAFVKTGGVSPSFTVTAGGTGYNAGVTIAITGGSGTGATATGTVVGGILTAITLTNAGSGYKAADTITVTVTPASGGGGSGATATGKVWPQFTLSPTTVAVYQGRVWLGGTRTLTWTGTSGYDDASAAAASGSTILSDADLVHNITALRALNNYLYIFGDNSIKQIGTISVSGSSTVFTIVTLSSDQGTTFPQTVVSYNRLILFANKVGVYAIFGASVEKVSAQMDGVFQNISFSLPLQAALNDVNNIHCYLLLASYNDPVANITRSILLTFMNKKWFIIAQGDTLTCLATAPINGLLTTYGSITTTGNDLTQILSRTDLPVDILLRTALAHNGSPHIAKRALRYLVTQSLLGSSPSTTMAVTLDTENAAKERDYTISVTSSWINNNDETVLWTNAAGNVVDWAGTGNVVRRNQADGTGIYLGLTMSGNFAKLTLTNMVIEYQDATVMASSTAA